MCRVAGMALVNLYDAKTRLSALVDDAAAGKEVIIAKAGKPMAKLVAVRAHVKRLPGSGKGKIRMTADFDAPVPHDLLDAFHGGT